MTCLEEGCLLECIPFAIESHPITIVEVVSVIIPKTKLRLRLTHSCTLQVR